MDNTRAIHILVCGDRNWTDKAAIKRELEKYGKFGDITVIHGAARGADTLAGEVAEELGYDPWPFPAEWEKYGRAAGPRRNQQMLDEGRPQIVLAFHPDLTKSKGTIDMVNRARRANVWVQVFIE